MIKTLFLLAPFVLLNSLSGCGDSPNSNAKTPGADTSQAVTPLPSDTEKTSKDAIIMVQSVEEIDVLMLESFPVQLVAVLKGNYKDGCTSFSHHEVSRQGNDIIITLYNTRPREAFCTEALVPFEQRVTIDAVGLKKGTYTVRSGEASKSFTLDRDNSLR